MDGFLSQDWSGILIALLVGVIGFGVFAFGRRRQGKVIRWGLLGIGGLVLIMGAVLLNRTSV